MFDKLFIFDIAQNHMGSVNKGLEIIDSVGYIGNKYPQFKFAIKFQFSP
jgi:hypothetical protein